MKELRKSKFKNYKPETKDCWYYKQAKSKGIFLSHIAETLGSIYRCIDNNIKVIRDMDDKNSLGYSQQEYQDFYVKEYGNLDLDGLEEQIQMELANYAYYKVNYPSIFSIPEKYTRLEYLITRYEEKRVERSLWEKAIRAWERKVIEKSDIFICIEAEKLKAKIKPVSSGIFNNLFWH